MLRDFTWCVNAGATQDTELRTNTVQFGDGYEQVSSIGINNARESASYSKTAYKAEIDAIHTFLLEHKGVTPFNMVVANELKTYRTDGPISKTHISGDVWSINFAVKQAFIP